MQLTLSLNRRTHLFIKDGKLFFKLYKPSKFSDKKDIEVLGDVTIEDAKRKSRLKTHKAQAIMDVYEMAVMTPEQRAFEDELIRVSQYVKTHHAHPGVLNKRVGCKYRGWVKISACGRKGNEYMLNRIKAMQFYGDWCPSTKLDEIIPNEFVDDGVKRCYHIDFFMTDIAGTEYEIDTQKIYNPKSMVDLQLQVASLVRSIAEQDGYLFDFDKSYVEIRA